MTGGLINIASYNSSDLYLTGSPQITFYKMVYRRYTNFAIECVDVPMTNRLEFGKESELIPPRIGDLIHKMYLHIVLPKLDITRSAVGVDIQQIPFELDDNSEKEFNDMKNIYMKHLMEIYRITISSKNVSNITYYQMIQYIQEYIATNDMITMMDSYTTLLNNTRDKLIRGTGKYAKYSEYQWIMDPSASNLLHLISTVNITRLTNNAKMASIKLGFIEGTDDQMNEQREQMKNIFKMMIENGVYYCRKVMEYFFIQYKDMIELKQIYANKNIRFAWISNIGHAIIDYIDLYIGGKKLDRHLGVWFTIWHQLTYRDKQKDIYNRMIGNVPELTEFNYKTKPSYDLYIPLNFWFNRFSGLSFPLVAMQYNDLRFTIRLKKLNNLLYIDRLYSATYINNLNNQIKKSTLTLTSTLIDLFTNRAKNKIVFETIELIDTVNIAYIYENLENTLYGDMLIDYIYLDNNERRRFAQSGHEYLIDTVQYREYNDISSDKINIELDMMNMSKEIIWVFRKTILLDNGYGVINNYSDFTNGSNQQNPMIDCQIVFNNYVRSDKKDGMFYDRFQPYKYHRTTPSKGINLFSFSLDPVQHQPSGNANFSRINVMLSININTDLYHYQIADIYPSTGRDFDFVVTINNFDLPEFLGKIDFDHMKEEIDTLQKDEKYLNIQKTNYLKTMIGLYNLLLATIDAHELRNVIKDNTNAIHLNEYAKQLQLLRSQIDLIIFKTSCQLTIFSRATNVLRIIGGYGGIAFDTE